MYEALPGAPSTSGFDADAAAVFRTSKPSSEEPLPKWVLEAAPSLATGRIPPRQVGGGRGGVTDAAAEIPSTLGRSIQLGGAADSKPNRHGLMGSLGSAQTLDRHQELSSLTKSTNLPMFTQR